MGADGITVRERFRERFIPHDLSEKVFCDATDLVIRVRDVEGFRGSALGRERWSRTTARSRMIRR